MQRNIMSDDARRAPTHVVIVLHGFMGFCNNVDQLARSIRTRMGVDALVIVPPSYQLLRSQDGIDVIARRVVGQLHDVVAAHPSLTSLSLIGYSMGGLIAHFVAGLLLARDPAPFFGLRPLNFVSIACPHVGARLVADGACSTRVLLRLAKLIGGRSAMQMTCADSETRLLALMAHRGSAFSRGLAAFQSRRLYSNMSGDRTVPFWTSFIAQWHAGNPIAPPAGRSPERGIGGVDYPHVAWEGALGGDGSADTYGAYGFAGGFAGVATSGSVDGAGDVGGLGGTGEDVGKSLTDVAAAPDGQRTAIYAAHPAEASEVRVTATFLPPAPPDRGLSLSQRCALLGLGVFALSVVLPLWLVFVLPTLLIAKGCRAAVVRSAPPPLEPALVKVSDNSSGGGSGAAPLTWSSALLQQMVEVSGASCAQEWIAAELNALRWHKVGVHFSVARDGLHGLHTHGHIVVRNRFADSVGQDVIQHLADHMLHTPLSPASKRI